MLELWLRLLALHLPEPERDGKYSVTHTIRNQWLLASRFHCVGCVPHGLEEACSSQEGREAVRIAIESLVTALSAESSALEPAMLNLLALDGEWQGAIERIWLHDMARAFIDLLDGRIESDASSTDIMPGSKPYLGSK